ncbi:SusD/RagB family nutrient-binding outer membrane lipoprotein [Arenibacter sp. TNZ]|jgi:tetratricopeptide (TPR) repeat protein|uniref:SusD/RagB family nutrient-binding outer membrane lipoprotein n=1 Tax=Arenibacter TaxID=178469 RepID=UPI000CD476F5|nr:MULTISPECIES: SusD/RagB family nutrient-binding outer membrane lipoprotein [Arenibacter]MCM4173436.1 SusD/RagB family nutrient-binding outer membrane lipoprotein [Arenibacter sp. TNZ]
MKKLSIMLSIVMATVISGCTEADFSENYANPSKVSTATVEKQFAGMFVANREYVLPAYWNYFVVLRTTLTRYTQAVGWVNASNQYVPGEAGIGGRWGNYYDFLSQYRELEKIYNNLSSEDQADLRVYMLTATIYLYDHTQRVVDLHGDIPFSDAGRLSQNGGDYLASLPAYDTAESIYTTMLDGLKGFSDELNSINVSPGIMIGFKTQDFVNGGDIATWKKYCNSLRLRMLTRVSGVSEFQSRAQSEISAILANPGQYPLVETNLENVQIDVVSLDTPIHSKGFRGGLEDWDGNLAGKAMIDHMLDNADPRLRAMYEPGEEAGGTYLGLDPLLSENVQTTLVAGGTLSRYNRSTLSRNEYFPGLLFTAAEVSLHKAEYYLKASNDAMAKASYEDAIEKSTEFYYDLRELSADGTSIDLVPTNDAEVQAYIGSADVNWDNATTAAEKLSLIATEKWIHFSVLQLPDSWAEQRRLNLPQFSFQPDNANEQTLPPNRWIYPNSERVYNTDNYNTVSSEDNLTTKLFWDVN